MPRKQLDPCLQRLLNAKREIRRHRVRIGCRATAAGSLREVVALTMPAARRVRKRPFSCLAYQIGKRGQRHQLARREKVAPLAQAIRGANPPVIIVALGVAAREKAERASSTAGGALALDAHDSWSIRRQRKSACFAGHDRHQAVTKFIGLAFGLNVVAVNRRPGQNTEKAWPSRTSCLPHSRSSSAFDSCACS